MHTTANCCMCVCYCVMRTVWRQVLWGLNCCPHINGWQAKRFVLGLHPVSAPPHAETCVRMPRHASGNEQVPTLYCPLLKSPKAGRERADPSGGLLSCFAGSNKQGTTRQSTLRQAGRSTAQREAGPVQTPRQRSGTAFLQRCPLCLRSPQRARGTTWCTWRGAARPRASWPW